MPDQAAGLRSLFARRRPSLLIVAGSDPCKAAVAVHFAREAAASARVTVLVDGTPGQVAGVCDIACRYELQHVLAGDLRLVDVMRPLTPHLLLLPAARAIERADGFTADEDTRLSAAFAEGIPAVLAASGATGGPDDAQVDLIVVHAADGKARRALEAFGRDARVVIVASDRPASLRGAYAELKALSQLGVENFEIVHPSFATDRPGDGVEAARVAYKNLAAAARRFLDIELVDGGAVRLVEPCAGDDAVAAPSSSDRTPVAGASSPPAVSPSITSSEVHHAAVVA